MHNVGDQFSIRVRKYPKYDPEYEEHYPITKVNENSTVKYEKGINNDVINIYGRKPSFVILD